MMMPSLFSQLVPRVSSSAETLLMRCANVCFRGVWRNGSRVDGAAIRAAAGSFTFSFAAYAGTEGGGTGDAGAWAGGNFASTGISRGSAGATGGGTGFGGAGGPAVGGVAGRGNASAGFAGAAGCSGFAAGATSRGGSAALGIPVGKGAGMNGVGRGIMVTGGGIS